MSSETLKHTVPIPENASLRTAWIIARRELRDTIRDWRIISPILVLTLLFPWLMNWTAQVAVNFVQVRDAALIGERLIPFLLMIVGFFPISFSLIIALETFVGEKERRSIEPLLAMPLSDLELYLGKVISATALPLAGSVLSITVYLAGLFWTLDYRPPLDLLLQIFALNIVSALVMVSGAVIVSSQTTSVRAANLLASFIIVPMALLIQAESIVMFWGNYEALWIVAVGLLVVTIILMRMGIRTFSREEILGREIDELNLRRSGQLFRHFFLAPPGGRPTPGHNTTPRARHLRLLGWIGRVYRHDLVYLLRSNRLPLTIVVISLVAAACIGWAHVAQFPLPAGTLNLGELGQYDFDSVSETGLLPSLTTNAIFRHNVQALLLAGAAGVISLGVLPTLMLMLPIVLIGFFAGQVAWQGYSPLLFLAVSILPHGLFEIPAAIVSTAFALRIGASITAPRAGLTVGEGLVAATADFVKVFLFLVVPLLLIAAFVEANLTLELLTWAYGG